jgi:hypothetical protein
MGTRWVRVSALLCAGLGLAVGCGGGGGGGPAETTVDLLGIAALDGLASVDGEASSSGLPGVGDVDGAVPGRMFRQFFAFGSSQIPPGATITLATLRVYQHLVVGSPFTVHGDIVVDYLDYGSSLDPADYFQAAIHAGLGPISTDATIGWKVLDVTAEVQDAVASGRDPKFRFAFSTLFSVVDGQSDYVAFEDAEGSWADAGHGPRLRVTYRD